VSNKEIPVTRTAEDNAIEFGVLSKQGKDLRLALLVACSVEKVGQGKGAVAPFLDATAFAKKAGTDKNRVLRHLEAWDRFAKKVKLPLAAKLTPDDATDLEITEAQAEVWETIILDERNRGTRVTPTSVAAAIKAKPEVAAAAVQALTDKGDVESLSRATAAAAKNRQVERNRKRVVSGDKKARSVADPKPQTLPEIDQAFVSQHGISDALRALVTTFPTEWNSVSDELRADEEYVEYLNEGFDKVAVALDMCRAMVNGSVTDDELQKLIEATMGEGE
jgi:hypothetical protein